MKQISLLALIAVLAVACQPDLPPLPSGKPTTTTASTTGTTGSTATSAAATTTATTSTTSGSTGSNTAATASTTGTTGATATTGTTTGSTTTATTKDAKPGDIAVRIFQLRQLQHAPIKAGNHTIDAFVADDDSKAGEGLMWVKDSDLKDNQGMIFVMPSATNQGFWMQNTLIPLDIVYIGTDEKVVNIVHGKPKDETTLPSTGPAKFVLELKDGTASKLGIAAGTKLNIPGDLTYKGNQQPQNGMSFPGQ